MVEYETMIVEDRSEPGQLQNYRIWNFRTRQYDQSYRDKSLERIVKDFNRDGWNVIPYPYGGVVLAMSRVVSE